MKIGVILQARTSSSRLPQKVLKELPLGSGITVLQQIIRRLKKAKKIQEIILATTGEKLDDEIVQIALKEGVRYFRGSLTDVLGRYYLAAKQNKLDVIVRITGDCPCVDPGIVDLVIKRHLEEKGDYTSNVVQRSYPDGFDVEVFSFQVLEAMFQKARQPDEREHVTKYIFHHPGQFKVVNVEADEELYAPATRITLDTPQDYKLLCAIFEALYPGDENFGAHRIMDFLKKNPSMVLNNT